ncbi:helix-turn-helix domain-containing protein [Ruegeria arenilitoris]|uniref:helix-turn-helix domain-containing protein n=1 Tax=Ruegeria arenilitoris TaxID=1173585 RepID=UPI001CFEEE26|nr:helix-turn-helix transcriptional regulator [Ruegeria arenilitoris]
MKKTDPRLEIVRQNLRVAFALKKTSAAEVSKKAGLGINTLGTFVNGNGSISYTNLLRVCDELQIPIGILHISGSVTPGRLELQGAFDKLTADQLADLLLEMKHLQLKKA